MTTKKKAATKKRWHVSGTVVAGTFVGTFEADTKEQAEALAWKQAGVSVCHHCAHGISDPEVTELHVELATPAESSS